jgi:hypothetical protein
MVNIKDCGSIITNIALFDVLPERITSSVYLIAPGASFPFLRPERTGRFLVPLQVLTVRIIAENFPTLTSEHSTNDQ